MGDGSLERSWLLFSSFVYELTRYEHQKNVISLEHFSNSLYTTTYRYKDYLHSRISMGPSSSQSLQLKCQVKQEGVIPVDDSSDGYLASWLLQVCPGSPLWHCSCCGRWASALAPASFFSLSSRTSLESSSLSLVLQTPLPACPFCGILMHRLLPDFLLSPTLV